MTQKKDRTIDTSEIWYGLPAKGILDLLGAFQGESIEEGTNIVAIRQDVSANFPLVLFDLSDGNVIPFNGNTGIATSSEMFDFFFDFKRLIEWTTDYFDRILANRKVITSIKSSLEAGKSIRNSERFQRQTDLHIEKLFHLMVDYPQMPVERFFWLIGGKEKIKKGEYEFAIREYMTSDDKKILLSVPITVSEMPKFYYDPTSGFPFSHQPEIRINNVTIQDSDILERLAKDGEINSVFFQDKFLSGRAFDTFTVAIATKLKRVVYSTFPDCFFNEEIRLNSLLDLYFQSWASDAEEPIMVFNPNRNKSSLEYFISKKMEAEKDSVLKEGVKGSSWLATTSLENLMQEFTHFSREERRN